MESKKPIIIAAVIALVVAGIIVGAIVYLTGLLRTRTTTTPNVVTSSPSSVITSENNAARPSSTPAPTLPSNMKIVGIAGFTMTYPSTWGKLSCSNSSNIEFDPYNATDQTATCDFAVKPITVLVAPRLSCAGETVTLGNNRVVRTKTQTQTGMDYRWCVYGNGMNLDITHRVSSTGSRATSKDDFSKQVEEMISSLRTGGAS